MQTATYSAGYGQHTRFVSPFADEGFRMRGKAEGHIKLEELSNESLRLIFPDVGMEIVAPLIHAARSSETTVRITAAIAAGVTIVLSLEGSVVANGNLRLSDGVFEIETDELRPQAEFVKATLTALLDVAGGMTFAMGNVSLPFILADRLAARELSRWLWGREIAWWLMVIERATGVAIEIPPVIAGEEVQTIRFVYDAITKRAADVVAHEATFRWTLVGEHWEQVRRTKPGVPVAHRIPYGRIERTVLGRAISLGPATVRIERGVVMNLPQLQAASEREREEGVQFVIKPESHSVRYELPDAPRLPVKPWGAPVDDLVRVGPKLDAALAERYNALARATLPSDQAAAGAMTERPAIGPDGVSVGDANEDRG